MKKVQKITYMVMFYYSVKNEYYNALKFELLTGPFTQLLYLKGKIMYLKIICSLIITISLCSCESSGDASSTSNLDLDGTWVSNCYLDDFDEYTIDVFVFSGSTFETSYKTWDNSTCTGTPMFADSASGAFTVGKTITTASGLEATEVDFTVSYYGQTFLVLDIIRKNGDEFNYGVYLGLNTRPTELDFNIVLSKL